MRFKHFVAYGCIVLTHTLSAVSTRSAQAQSVDAGVARAAVNPGSTATTVSSQTGRSPGAVPAQTTAALVRELATMPLAELRGLIAPAGLDVCIARHMDDERIINRRRRCRLKPVTALTDSELTRLRRGWRFSVAETDSLLQVSSVRCQRTADREICRATVAGPAGTNMTVAGAHFEFGFNGSVRQLVRVVAWSM